MEERDVNQELEQEASANSQEGVDTEESAQPQEVESQPAQETQSGEGHQPVEEQTDEMGVPFKNRYMEMKRKYEDLDGKFSKVMDKLEGLNGSQQQQYTPEQLEAYANQTDNPAYSQWAAGEAQRLRKEQERKEYANIVEKKLTEFQTKQKAEQEKQQIFGQVVQRHPDLVKKDNAGNVMGWNTKSPLYQRASQYMSDPQLRNNPKGLRVAVALANEDLAVTSGKKTQQQVDKQKQEIRNLQKKTLTEGGGVKGGQPSSPRRDAIERARESGHIKDATQAMKHILGLQK